MAKKHHLIFLVLLLIISVVLLIYINLPKEEKEKIYSDDPKKWIDTKGNVRIIDVEEATAGAGYIDSQGQQYNDKDISTAFKLSGFYKGNFFEESYADENGKVLMKIAKDMKPFDNIIEGFIIEKIKDGKPVVNVFLDEDWKKTIGATSIRFGRNFEKRKTFEFKSIASGIYMDEFEDDSSRFLEDYSIHFGGIIAGDVSDEKINNGDTDITLIKFS